MNVDRSTDPRSTDAGPSEELFETFDDDGNPLGLVARSEVHRRGLWHRASNVFLFDSEGLLYLQRRAAGKDIWPNAWDMTVGEHLQPGESFEQGALRGLVEELAISGVVLEPLGAVVRGTLDTPELHIRDYELQQSFRGIYDGELLPDPIEVADVKRLSLTALAAEVAADPDAFTPWLRSRLRAFGWL